MDARTAIRDAHEWFEQHSGWAPPDLDTLAEWLADGVCRAPDECLVPPEGWCEHGLASWWLIVWDLEDPADPLLVPHPDRLAPSRADRPAILAAHLAALRAGEAGYLDPTTGLFVLTSGYLRDRGYCCEQGCRHCPYVDRP